MINIPEYVFNKYYEVVDYMLESDNFSAICTVYYPPIKEACNNCVGLADTTANNYSFGGPAPFSFNNCELCGGNGFRESEPTDTLRLRTYWQKKDWIKQGNIVLADMACMIIGYKSDLPKILRAVSIELCSEETTLKVRYRLAGQPFFSGLGKTRYFAAYLQK